MTIGWRPLWLAGSLLWLSGCATYSEQIRGVEADIAAGRYAEALKAMEQSRDPLGKDQVLLLLNKGMLLRLQGDYSGSNAAFEQAKQTIDELDAVSVSEQAGSVTVNDALRSYLGEDYERSLLHFYEALNYLQLGKPDAARVEALQADVEKMDDALMRYLAGLIFEQLGEWSDAMIAYRKSYQQYQKTPGVAPPRSLGFALLRMSEHLGLTDEVRDYKAAFGIDSWESLSQRRDQGELVVLVGEGLAPIKREEAAHMHSPELGIMVRIATPSYVSRPRLVDGVRVLIDGVAVKGELVEDVDASARKALADQMAAITARALARAVVKYRAAKEMRDKNGGLAGFITNVAGMVTERADTRSWSTLPQSIYLARRSLPPGSHRVEVELLGRGGGVLAKEVYPAVTIAAGDTQYRAWRWISPSAVLTMETRR